MENEIRVTEMIGGEPVILLDNGTIPIGSEAAGADTGEQPDADEEVTMKELFDLCVAIRRQFAEDEYQDNIEVEEDEEQ